MTDLEYQFLKKKVLNITGIDLESYKSQQMRRRLTSFIENINTGDVATYCRSIEQDETGLRKLCDFLTINVTEFFRDAWAFNDLQNAIFPLLIENARRINVWSAGCSNGAEAYTIAMLLHKNCINMPFRILGTDMDELSLSKARAGGPYKMDMLKSMPGELISGYLVQDGDNYWVRQEIKDMVIFKRHNLLSDPFEKGFDLVACRNVTIYFTDEARDKLNRRIYESLKNKGILFVGATEFILNAGKIGFRKTPNRFLP